MNRNISINVFYLGILLASLTAFGVAGADKVAGEEAFPGEKTDFRGYDRYEFIVLPGRPNVIVICPKQAAAGKPWIWCGSFWGNKVRPFTELTVIANMKLVEQGFHWVIAGPNVFLGHPDGNAYLDVVYKELTGRYGLAKKPALEGLSREGLGIYRWASANPEKVGCIYLDNGVCDFKSWPGGKGKGKGDPAQWALLLKTYGLKSDVEAMAYDKNPIDLLKPLVDANVPLLHVCGDADDVVPYEENSAIIKSRYEELGGKIEIILKKGAGHHPHGLEDPTPIINFIIKNAGNQ
jgi:pimeloyl-ACP methyl ester carboxylesterase